LREGSKILEDQLRLMDEHYIETKQKVFAAQKYQKQSVDKLNKEMYDLRLKYALANNGKLLDQVTSPLASPLASYTPEKLTLANGYESNFRKSFDNKIRSRPSSAAPRIISNDNEDTFDVDNSFFANDQRPNTADSSNHSYSKLQNLSTRKSKDERDKEKFMQISDKLRRKSRKKNQNWNEKSIDRLLNPPNATAHF
jgi:hypothetical protein